MSPVFEENAASALRLREQDLAPSVTAVSGASKGIGRATVLNLAGRGCSVLYTCSTNESLHLIDAIGDEVKTLFQSNDRLKRTLKIIGIVADIFSPDRHITTADAVKKHLVHLNIIVPNAGARAGGGVGTVEIENMQRLLSRRHPSTCHDRR